MEGFLSLIYGYFGGGFSRIHKPYPYCEHIGEDEPSILGTNEMSNHGSQLPPRGAYEVGCCFLIASRLDTSFCDWARWISEVSVTLETPATNQWIFQVPVKGGRDYITP